MSTPVWLIVLLTIVSYQALCFISILIDKFLGKDSEETMMYLCCGLFLMIYDIYDIMRMLYKNKHGLIIVQRNRESFRCFDYVPVLAKYKDIQYFKNSSTWHVWNSDPTKKDIKDGYSETIENVKHVYNFAMISDEDLDDVKSEYKSLDYICTCVNKCLKLNKK